MLFLIFDRLLGPGKYEQNVCRRGYDPTSVYDVRMHDKCDKRKVRDVPSSGYLTPWVQS